MAEPSPAPSALTARALLVGLGLSVVVAMYSAYAGLKVGGVYWPIITATLMSMGILRLLGGASPREVSIAGTAASTGGLLAAGVLFTVPAAWLSGVDLGVLDVTLIALVGGVLGVAFTLPLREEMIERLALPYPDGAATARVIEAGDAGGASLVRLLAAAGLAGLFTVARDAFGLLPPVANLSTLKLPGSRHFSFGSSISLVPLAGGYLIGPVFTGVWFAGAAATYLVAVPILVASGASPDLGTAVATLTRPFGIGVIVGASLVYFLARGLPALRPMLRRLGAVSGRRVSGIFLALGGAVLLIAFVLKLPLWLTAVAVLASFAVAYIAARIAGELNIDPMEIFAIAALLLVLLFVRLPAREAVVFAALLAIAAGMGGDFMQDLKAGALVGTRPSEQARAQLASVVVSALVIGVVLKALDNAYTIGSVDLPAPQAVALAAIVKAGHIDLPLAWGGATGAVLTILSLATGRGILPVAFGIGLYAPMELSLPLFAGGMLRLMARRSDHGSLGREESGRLLAAGAIAGEGFIGVILALLGLAGVL